MSPEQVPEQVLEAPPQYRLAECLLDALALPAGASVDQRVPKKMLVEQGAPTGSDKRLLSEALDEVQWLATLKPGTVAIPAYRDEQREYLEVVVIHARVRASHDKPATLRRLAELLHRAVPYPVWLLLSTPHGAMVSLAHKRASQNEAGKTVLEGDIETLTTDSGQPPSPAWLESLALSRQPRQHLFALYQGWLDGLAAAEAERLTGRFVLPRGPEEAAGRRHALQECRRLEQEATRLRGLAEKESQMAKRVALNLALQRVQADWTALRAQI